MGGRGKPPRLYSNIKGMKNYASTGLILALVLSFSMPAEAQSVYGEADGSAETSVGVSGAVNSSFGAEVKGVVNALVGAEAATSGSVDASGSADGSANADASNTLEVIVVTRADIDAETAGAVSISPSSVSSDADLSGFVAAQIAADENVSEVKASSNNVSVTYEQQAKLFGIIPVTVNATATVRADGSVDVRYPWYAFIMVTNESALETEIENRVEATLSANATGEASARATLTAQAQAVLVNEVRSAMEQSLAADVAADAEVAVEGGSVVEVK